LRPLVTTCLGVCTLQHRIPQGINTETQSRFPSGLFVLSGNCFHRHTRTRHPIITANINPGWYCNG